MIRDRPLTSFDEDAGEDFEHDVDCDCAYCRWRRDEGQRDSGGSC